MRNRGSVDVGLVVGRVAGFSPSLMGTMAISRASGFSRLMLSCHDEPSVTQKDMLVIAPLARSSARTI